MLKSEQKNNGFEANHARHYKIFTVNSRLRYLKPHASEVVRTFADEIRAGLDRKSKYIHPKFFYDRVGSDLFERICASPEYYLTRTELEILEDVGRDLGSVLAGMRKAGCGSGSTAAVSNVRVRNGDCAGNGGLADSSGRAAADAAPGSKYAIRLVELGSGSSVKTRLLLEPLFEIQDRTEYFPIDISDILAESSEELLADYDSLRITGIIDTYEGGLEFLRTYDDGRNLIAFLGSSYGNLSPVDGAIFLRKVRAAMKPGDLFLIGLDMVKDSTILEPAYDDSGGVTAAFNLNVLSRINAELDADFDLANFAHRAKYNADAQRVEMHLESLSNQSVIISKAGLKLRLRRGELIHTENSYKYLPGQVHCMLDSAGFGRLHEWTDDLRYVTLTLAVAR